MKSRYLVLAVASFYCPRASQRSLIQEPAEESRPPNIVLILVDDMGYTDIGAFGSEVADTQSGCPGICRRAADQFPFVAAVRTDPVDVDVRLGQSQGRHGIDVSATA